MTTNNVQYDATRAAGAYLGLQIARSTDRGVTLVDAAGNLEESVTPYAGRTDLLAIPKTLYVVPITVASVDKTLSVAYASLVTAIAANRMLTLIADGGKVWFRFSASAGTVDETQDDESGSPGNICEVLFEGIPRELHAGTDATHLIVKGSVACKLRITVSGHQPTV